MPRRFDFVSPGVQLTEIDQSTVPTTLEGDGPLIVGRALKGPANVPVRVRSYDDFVAIFGEPVYGPTETIPDTWRNGNTVAPQYGGIAAQAWLSSEESPITFIRLLGEQSPSATTAGEAGWNTANNQDSDIADNGGAYGLFLINSGSGADLGTGCLAAIWYLATGSLELSGNLALDDEPEASAAKLIESVGDKKFKLIIKGEADAETIETFSFDPTANDYIRSVFNTDAYKTNSSITPSADLKTYWLGETFEEQVDRYIQTGSGEQYGIILGLGTLESTKKYWQNNREGTKPAKTGFFINRDPNADTSSYSPESVEKLFRVVSLHDGEEFQKEYYISIEDLALGTSVNPNSSFSLKVRRWDNNAVVETYSNLNLNWSTENHIVKRIGDMNMVWSDNDKKFNMEGEYPNQSDYIRIEMADALKAGGLPQDRFALPFGFHGPMKPIDFVLTSGSAEPDSTSSFALGEDNIPTNDGTTGEFAVLGDVDNDHALTASFVFPDLRLTTENSYGSLNQNYLNTALFGIRQNLSGSTSLDQSYRDIVRDLPAGLDIHGDSTSANLKRSFIFSLDDIRESSGRYYYASGSRADGESYTAKSGSLKLLQTVRVKQFAAPFFGGFDGVDITELDPFANRNIGTSETGNYEFYTLNKVLDIAADVDNVDMDLLAIPGVNKSTITDRMIEVADERQDCLALIDLESAYTPAAESTANEAAGTAADVISSARARNFDSSYAAAYHPWVRVNDPGGNGTIVAVPPTVAAIGAIGKSQQLSYPWFAPAGFNRGGISQLGGPNGPVVTSTAETLNKANRDDLYETNINPIARLQGDFVIFGQKTLQQVPSALDRINVRRLMIYVKKRIGEIADTILFDNNIEATWNRFSTRANRVLGTIQSQGGIVDYKVQLDSSTTTPDLQDRNILYAKVYIKPARAIEFIAVDFIITRSGVQF